MILTIRHYTETVHDLYTETVDDLVRRGAPEHVIAAAVGIMDLAHLYDMCAGPLIDRAEIEPTMDADFMRSEGVRLRRELADAALRLAAWAPEAT